MISSQDQITFTNSLQSITISKEKQYTITANYELGKTYKYLYIYPIKFEISRNYKGIIRLYFKQISSKDDPNKPINYLHSDFSTIDFNSGLFIPISDLTEKSAKIFIISYEAFSLSIQYRYMNNIVFPSYNKYSNSQLNQFILKKGESQSIKYSLDNNYYEYLLILFKNSLRNVEVEIKYNNDIVTKEMLAYLYPNGYSVFLDKRKLKENRIDFTIKNNNNKDEIILLGYMHHKKDELFPNPITNGFQMYLEGNSTILTNLTNSGNNNFDQYFTYQTYSKKLEISFMDTSTGETYIKETHKINEYNSMFHYKINYSGYMRFDFTQTPKRNAFYFQYLDYNEIEITQKSLQPLITGVPKSIILPKGKSLYHFLPIDKFTKNLNYYLRAKTQEKIYVSFETCNTYPEGCSFTQKADYGVEAIENLGLWYTIPRNISELQLIYVYCENECSYDILMTYDDDPLFLFPENDYSKFIGDSGKDIFILPIFEYLETSSIETLYIDLVMVSGVLTAAWSPPLPRARSIAFLE